MPIRGLTVAAVERIKPPARGQVDHFDAGYPGLAVRVSYGGARTWVFFFRLHGGRVRRMTLGRWPGMGLAEARSAWQEARKLVGAGQDPARPKPRAGDLFENVMAEWLHRDQAGNRTRAEVERVLRKDVLPAWEGRLLGNISRRDVRDLIDGVVDRGSPITARRVHAMVHRLFSWAVDREIITVNPATGVAKPPEATRDRVLQDSEVAVVWRAAERIGYPFGPLVQLLTLTAARRNEIAGLQWTEIRDGCIYLPAERVKNASPHTIPIAPQAAIIIERLPRIEGRFVFTADGRNHIRNFSRAKQNLDAAAAEINGAPLVRWRLHDLRRVVATGLQRLGTTLQTIEAVLGHTGGSRAGVVGRYQRHAFEAEKRIALEAWARHVESITKNTGIIYQRFTRL
jgi:integrase